MNKLPIYVALDVDSKKQALFVAEQTSPYVEGFKVGPRLLLRAGPGIIHQLKPFGKVFLDLKFFDIPSTMLSAVESAFFAGADMVTVHAGAGAKALSRLAEKEAQLQSKRPFRILAVTVLTSFDSRTLPPLARMYPVSTHVESLANLVIKSGLSGLVCAGHELKTLRERYPLAYLLTPGIRPLQRVDGGHQTGGHQTGDQKRVYTPQRALKEGANALVIGRPIYQAKDPRAVCVKLTSLKTIF